VGAGARDAGAWWRRRWEAWKRIARRIAEFQGRLTLTILYLVLILPVGLCLRLCADPLRRRRPVSSNWTSRAAAPPTMAEAGRQ
jgi:hypothetical protein